MALSNTISSDLVWQAKFWDIHWSEAAIKKALLFLAIGSIFYGWWFLRPVLSLFGLTCLAPTTKVTDYSIILFL